MKFKYVKLLFLIFTLALSLGLFTACGSHTHDYLNLKSDGTSHWYECSCGKTTTPEAHSGGKATCSSKPICEMCNLEYGEKLAEHTYTILKNDTSTHWYECICGAKSNIEEHKGGTATCTSKAVCEVCSLDYGETLPHNYQSVVTEPTCTEYGFVTYTCDCGDTYVDDYVYPLYHDYGDWIESQEGAIYKVCSRDDKHKFYAEPENEGETVLYSARDGALDFPSLKRALNEQNVEIYSLNDIQGYIVNGETVDRLKLNVTISNAQTGYVDNYGRDRTVAIPQTVTVIIRGKQYVLNYVYAYTKIIDDAEDLKIFTLDGNGSRNEINGYFIVTKNIDASELKLDAHVFNSGSIYPGNGYNADVGFKGILDGQGHVIDGLTLLSNGLFGNANAPIIKNIAFTNVNLTGYYPCLFAHSFSRGKKPNNDFNGYEGGISNVYVSVKSIQKPYSSRVGILVNNVLPAATKLKNVVVEYLNIDADIQTLIDNGNSFYMFGSSSYSMAGSVDSYNNCYAISTAPVLAREKMPGFAENQVEFTVSKVGNSYKVVEVGKVLDDQVNKILSQFKKELTVDYVLVGLRTYDDYNEMALDATANADSLATFDSKYWTIENGVPTFKSL